MGGEKKVYTLYQLNRSIKNALETKAGESGVWVKAEIAKVSKSKPGHVYIDFVCITFHMGFQCHDENSLKYSGALRA